MDLCESVRRTTKYVFDNSEHVKIDGKKIEEECKFIAESVYKSLKMEGKPKEEIQGLNLMNWGEGLDEEKEKNQDSQVHFKPKTQNEEEMSLYILLLSSINFCFWPIKDFEYNTLANNLKKCFIEKRKEFLVENLPKMTEETLKKYIFTTNTQEKQELLIHERARLIREVGTVLNERFEGKVTNLIAKCNKSCTKLVSLITRNFPGFRDNTIYKGRQIFFLKRAQIFCGDLYGEFDGKSIGNFNDIEKLTMFPDYRVPQYFIEKDIFKLTKSLDSKIMKHELILPNSPEEIEIRAASVQVVEIMKKNLLEKYNINTKSHEIDWYLWEKTEKIKDEIKPHHETLTIFY